MTQTDTSTEFDLIVIGAGINGAGIARDAAMRGLKVLVLDKGDIGGGTSSWSTRLIHGGLRYLEHGEFGLVRESLRERARLMSIAPHLVRPLAMLVPIYEQARRGVLTIRVGMISYDLLSFEKRLPRHQMLSRAETLRQAPGLNAKGLRGAARYFDAQVEFAERLVVENVLSAVEHGATIITYAQVDKLIIKDGKVRGVEFNHSPKSNVQSPMSGPHALASSEVGFRRVQGEVSQGQEGGLAPALTARARVVINAAGPWVDQLLELSNIEDSPRLIGGTKGSHLIVAPFAGAPDVAVYVEAETDRRPFFIIPWNGTYLIGTTDIRYDGDLDHVHINDEEIDYLLRETNRVVPEAKLTRQHILYTYSGVRPLPFAGSKAEQSITRRHFIRPHSHAENLFSIIGGKLTTYRSLAEQAVDQVFNHLGQDPPKSTTARDPLPGATTPDFPAFCKEFQQNCGLVSTTSDRLLRIYGARAPLVLELIAGDASLAEVFDNETGALAAELVLAFTHELAQTLTDCLLRRTMVGLNSTCGLDALDAAARVAQKHLGWSDARVSDDVDAYRDEIRQRKLSAIVDKPSSHLK